MKFILVKFLMLKFILVKFLIVKFLIVKFIIVKFIPVKFILVKFALEPFLLLYVLTPSNSPSRTATSLLQEELMTDDIVHRSRLSSRTCTFVLVIRSGTWASPWTSGAPANNFMLDEINPFKMTEQECRPPSTLLVGLTSISALRSWRHASG